ncbi:LCCL domain protein [Aspergillus luchuensis]|uniref:LCCL domain protein n=1 Tax=Aspergillus kawachii TaxID=1069201 RepID=A0A146F0B4_ASPKA|nr:LCCL domain protein [Aspergillus luchuensis]
MACQWSMQPLQTGGNNMEQDTDPDDRGERLVCPCAQRRRPGSSWRCAVYDRPIKPPREALNFGSETGRRIREMTSMAPGHDRPAQV